MSYNRGQIPTFSDVIGSNGKLTNNYVLYLESLTQQLPPPGQQGVIDGTSTSQPTTLFNNAIGYRPLANPGSLFFSKDTGEIFNVNDSGWQQMVPQFSGDVTNTAFSSTLTLSNVNSSPGDYTNANITVDSKGRITSIENGTAQGSPVFENGDLAIGTGWSVGSEDRLAIGQEGQVLMVDQGAPQLVAWKDTGTVEIVFNHGDATPTFLYTLTQNRVIETIEITITTAFDDVASTLEVGTTTVSDELQSSDMNFPSLTGQYISSPTKHYATAEDIYLTINGGSSTVGTGIVKITYLKDDFA